MTDKFDDKEYDITLPLTKGEQYQLEKLKKFSEDPKEIKIVRRKLRNAGYGDENTENTVYQDPHKPIESISDSQLQSEETYEPGEQVDNSTGKKQPVAIQKKQLAISNSNELIVLQRRREDRPAFPNYSTSFVKSLLAIFINSSVLTNKYNKDRLIRISIINLFLHGCGFILGQNVQQFVLQTILKWQETFKPLLVKLYKAGWRDNKGKSILTPLEFNLLQITSRLASERNISQIKYHWRDTRYIFARLNPFIYCYFQLVNAGLQKLLIAFKKGFKNLARDDSNPKLFEKYEDYNIQLIDFFNGCVEKKFIIPLLESITGRPLEPGSIRTEAFVLPVDEDDYRADAQLKMHMAVRAKQYENEFKKKMNILCSELAFLDSVREDLNRIYHVAEGKDYTSITLALAVTLKENNNLLNGRVPATNKSKTDTSVVSGNHVIKNIYYALSFFLDFYSSLLTEKISVYGERGVEYVELFNKNVFGNHCRELAILHKNLINFFQLDFAQITTDGSEKDYHKTKSLQLVDKICIQIYSIGKKLYKATNTSVMAKPSFKGLDILNLGKFRIPFEERKLFSHLSRSQGALVVSLHNKLIKEIMADIRIFCFDFLRYFELPSSDDRSVHNLNMDTRSTGIKPKENFHSGKANDEGAESLFLDSLVIPDDENSNIEMHVNSNGSASEQNHDQEQPKKTNRKTLLSHLNCYEDVKNAIEQLKNGEEITYVPDEP